MVNKGRSANIQNIKIAPPANPFIAIGNKPMKHFFLPFTLVALAGLSGCATTGGQASSATKTSKDTVAGLNRDTATAHTAAQKQDVQAMQQKMEAERAIKQEAFKQITAVTTDLVYKQQTGDQKIILQICEAGGQNCRQEKVDAADVKVINGKAYVFNNGIMTNETQALETAARQSGDTANAQGVYAIINPYTGNPVAEVLSAGWDKLNEITSAALPVSSASEANIDVRNVVKVQGGLVIEVDHSRGTLTSAIGTAEQVNRGVTDAAIGSVTFNGGAANAQRMADNVDAATGGRVSAGEVTVQQSTHQNDLVGNVIGGNAPTGGNQIPFLDSHRSYTGSLPPELDPNGDRNDLRDFTNKAWGDGKISQPVKITPSSKEGAAQ
jgi:filamentous hemagglutinin